MKVPGPVGACTHTTRVLSHYSLLLHTPLRSWHGGVLKLAACPRYPRYPLHHWLLCHSLHIHTFSRTRKCARCVCARCARFGDRTVPFLVRSGDRTVLIFSLVSTTRVHNLSPHQSSASSAPSGARFSAKFNYLGPSATRPDLEILFTQVHHRLRNEISFQALCGRPCSSKGKAQTSARKSETTRSHILASVGTRVKAAQIPCRMRPVT